MTYSKPEILTLTTPLTAIKGLRKRAPHITDTIYCISEPEFTIAAYEADE